jgi:hypothetical protein
MLHLVSPAEAELNTARKYRAQSDRLMYQRGYACVNSVQLANTSITHTHTHYPYTQLKHSEHTSPLNHASSDLACTTTTSQMALQAPLAPVLPDSMSLDELS